MEYDNEAVSSRKLDLGNKLDEGAIREIVEFYEAELQLRTTGPQLEGLEKSQLEKALQEEPENIHLLDIVGDNGEVIGKWPLFVPISYHQDYSQDFFKDHYKDEAVYFFSLPPYDNIEELVTSPDRLNEASDFLSSRHAIITYDYREGDDVEGLIPGFLDAMLAGHDVQLRDITPESKSEAWNMNYGLPKTVFYEGQARLLNPPEVPSESVQAAINEMIADGEMEITPETGRTVISAEQLQANDGELLEKLWSMYNAQFNILVEDHPALFQQPKEEFYDTLLDPDTLNVAYMYEGRPVGLLYPVSNIEKCVWLNPKYYEDKYGADENWLAFYTGVVVAADMAQQDMGFIQEMMNTVTRVAEKVGKDLVIAFACSNISKTYIPKITQTFIDSNYPDEERRLKYPRRINLEKDQNGRGFAETATYKYHVARVSPLED